MRFELVDAVVERNDERIVTIKNVTAAEEYLADHFPGFPVLPGVMMLEALVQAARGLIPAGNEPFVLSEVRNVRYGNMVRPGQTLRVEVERREVEDGEHRFQGRGFVGRETAVQGRFTLRPLRKT